MPHFLLFQVIVVMFITLSIFLLAWLFPIHRHSKKKSKAKRV